MFTAEQVLTASDNQWLLDLWPTIIEQADVKWYDKARDAQIVKERIEQDVNLHMKCTRDLDLTARYEIHDALWDWWSNNGFWSPRFESYIGAN